MRKRLSILIALLVYGLLSHGQIITTIAGTGASTFAGENIPATAANTPNPNGGTFDRYGNYYFADAMNANRIRRITPSGIISTVAGNGTGGFMGDGGPATLARLNSPSAVAFDTLGNMYIADAQNFRIRKVDIASGIIMTVAGTGTGGYYGEGIPATDAMIWGVSEICVDKHNNIYIADGQNARVRKINSSGIITTYAGNGIQGHTGDGLSALTAEIAWPTGIALDDTGNLYIACNSSFSNRIRKVSMSGIITTIVGNGTGTYIGDGMPATDAQLAPSRIAVDGFSNLFINDRYNNRVYKVDAASGIFYNVAGTGTVGDGGDGGPATLSTLNYPGGITTDACGNLYITTVGSVSVVGSGRRIRKVTFSSPTMPTIAITGITTASIGTTVIVNATLAGAGTSYTIKWFKNTTLFSITTTPSTTYIKGTGTDTITAKLIPTITYCYDSTTSLQHIITTSSVAVNDIRQSSFSATLSPNPATTHLTITSPEKITTITITNHLGQTVHTRQYNTETVQVNVAELPAGLYFVKVNGSAVRKFVRE